MNGVYFYSQTKKILGIDYYALSAKHKKVYDEAINYVSDKHPIKCLCGRLCTGLHEKSCQKFRNAVNKEFLKRIKYDLQIKELAE